MDDGTAAEVDVAYEGRPHGLEFVVGDKRLQQVTVRNGSTQRRLVLKIQSTSSRKFRVRPGLAVVAPCESLAVQIQLSPHERDASECKFLLVIRRVHPEDKSPPEESQSRASRLISTYTKGEATQQQRDADDRAVWQRAEANHQASLVLSETIIARIVMEPNKVPVVSPPPKTTNRTVLRPTNLRSDPQGIAPPQAHTELLEPLRIDALEARARVVVLLMKNQSKLAQNQLTTDEKTTLRRLRETNASEWLVVEDYARRMRALARQLEQKTRAERAGEGRP